MRTPSPPVRLREVVALTIIAMPATACAQSAAVSNARMWQAILASDSAAVAGSLARGADPNLSTSDGVSALMLAASTGHAGTMAVLLAKGARANDSTTKHHLSALMVAANGCSRPAVDLLLARGADPKPRDTDKGSAADWAFRGCKDSKDVVPLMTLLHDKGASVQPRGDIIGLLFAEAAPPPLDSLLKVARTQFRP